MAVDHADNVSNVLPNEIVEWDDKLAEVEGVEVIPNRGCTPKSMTERLSANVLGLATSTDHVSEYTARHRRKEIELPEYYSTFEKEFGTDEGKMNYIGPVSERFHYTDGEAEFGLDSTLVEAALRALDGGGRYDSGEYVPLTAFRDRACCGGRRRRFSSRPRCDPWSPNATTNNAAPDAASRNLHRHVSVIRRVPR